MCHNKSNVPICDARVYKQTELLPAMCTKKDKSKARQIDPKKVSKDLNDSVWMLLKVSAITTYYNVRLPQGP